MNKLFLLLLCFAFSMFQIALATENSLGFQLRGCASLHEKSSGSNEFLNETTSTERGDRQAQRAAINMLYKNWKDLNFQPSDLSPVMETEQGPIALNASAHAFVKLAASCGFTASLVPLSAGEAFECHIGNSATLFDSARNLVYLKLDNETPAGFGEIMHDPFLVLRTKPTNLTEFWEIKDAWENLARFPLLYPSIQPKILFDSPIENYPSPQKERLSIQADGQLLPFIAVANQTDYFDHTTPYFMLHAEGEACEKMWWQISDTPDFSCLIPNFEAIQPFEEVITLDALTNTFFLNNAQYYFRIKASCQGRWGAWSPPFAFLVKKPEAVRQISFVKLAKDTYALSWEKSSQPDTTYLVFASNSRDFVPSLYTDKQINALYRSDNNSEIIDWVPNVNFLLETPDNRLIIDGKYAYYRIVSQRKGFHAVPSPLVYVYDQGRTHPRDILQCAVEGDHLIAKRTAFPPPYHYLPFHDPILCHLKTVKSLNLTDLASLKCWTKSPYVDSSIWEKVAPHLLPENHPAREQLDRIFCVSTRVIFSSETLKEAGFYKSRPRPYSRAIISHHPYLDGYLVKMFSDVQPKVVDWEQWVRRIKGALSVQEFILKHNCADIFKVPNKWIYPLPPEPSPPLESYRKNFICVVEDMEILERSENYAKWKGDFMNQTKLDAVFLLLKEEGLSDSVRAFNLPIAKDDKIAVLDTEYHHRWPVRYDALAEYLSPEMQIYWQRLIDNDEGKGKSAD